MKRQVINPDDLFDSLQYGFSQIAIGSGQKVVSISGQVGWDQNQQITDAGDLRSQTTQAFRNLERAVQAAGGTLDDILSLRIYIVDRVMDESAPIRENLKTFFPESPPTATWIGVSRLADKDFLIEVEALAIIDSP